MDLFDTIDARYSVRAYRPDPVDDALVHRVLDAAVKAPSAHNYQPFRMIVVHTEGREEEFGRLYSRSWLLQAPVVIGMVAVPSEAWERMDGKNYAEVDATIAMDHLVLAASSLGLGTCWIAAFDPAVAREMLNLPDDVEPLAFTPLGYAAREPRPRIRRSFEELVRYERW
jgi:nitroreductase